MVSKHIIGSHGGTVGAWSDGDRLPVFLEILYPEHLFQKLSEIYTLHLRCSLCHRHLRVIAFTSVLSVTLCALLYKSFSLSLHISAEQ